MLLPLTEMVKTRGGAFWGKTMRRSVWAKEVLEIFYASK